MKKLKKTRRATQPSSRRRQLERLLKQIMAGKVSIQTVAHVTKKFPQSPYSRWIE